MEAVEELKKKPREEWTEEDKGKSKGMMEKIIMTLGAAGMAIITGIFMFATWVYAKSANGEESEMNESVTEGGAPEEFANAETSFTQEDTFSGGQSQS
jgi:flagellar basal body-associated protein FliL